MQQARPVPDHAGRLCPPGEDRQGHARPLAPAPPALPAQQTEAEGVLGPPFTDEETEAQEVQGTQTL